MATDEEKIARYNQQRELLQKKREKALALIQDLEIAEAATVLASAMNDHLLPSNHTAYFMYRSSFSGER